MIGYFLVSLGSILLFCAVIEFIAKRIDRRADWKDWDRTRREDRRVHVRRQYWDRQVELEALRGEWATLP